MQDESTPAESARRIALVTGGLPLGGSTTFLCNLGGELIRTGIPAEVFSFEKKNPLASDFHRLKVPVFCQDEHSSIYEDRLWAILRELRRFKPTVVIANLSQSSFEVLRYLPRGVFRCGIVHADSPKVYDSLRHYAPVLDAMAVVSQTIRVKVCALPEFTRVPVPYLPLGVPMPMDKPARTFSGPLRILYFGRLDREQKRVHLFPEILATLKASGIPFHWTIAGDGPDGEWLKRTMQSAGAHQTVAFHGSIPYAEVPRLLEEHDVFLLASDYEGLPLSLLEAMGRGLVPVVSDLPSGIRELVDETTGKRVAPQNTKDYAEAILWLHSHRDEMGRLAWAARARVHRDFSVAAMTDRWLKAFPESLAVVEAWPTKTRIEPILGVRQPLFFSGPMRVLRRMAARLRS